MAIRAQDYQKRLMSVLAGIPAEANRRMAFEYVDELRANGVKPSTLINHAYTLRDIAQQLGDRSFESVEKRDIVRFVNARERERVWRSRRKNGENVEVRKTVTIADSTMQQRKVNIRAFFKWLRKDGTYPPEVSWLKTTRPSNGSIPVDELVTPDDLRALLQAHPHPQHKAILAVLYEAGTRSGELCSMNIGSVEFDRYGAVIMLPTDALGLKTGARRIRLFATETGCIYLQKWVDEHPKRHDKKAALFYSMSHRAPGLRMTPGALYDLCMAAEKKTGLGKHITPRLFRHTSATNKAREGWREAELRAFFGWERNSAMPATYVHLAGLDYEKIALKRKGLIEEGDRGDDNGLAPRPCKVCRAENLPTALFCQACRAPVSPQAEAELSERHDQVLAEMVQREMQRVLGSVADGPHRRD